MGYATIRLTPSIIERLIKSRFLVGEKLPADVKICRFGLNNNIGQCGVIDVFLEHGDLYHMADDAEIYRIPVELNNVGVTKHINYSSTELCEV